MRDQVSIFKLVTGEEVIAKVGGDTDESVILFSPLVLVPVRKPDGTALVMSPFTFGADISTGVKISKTNIMCTMPPEPGLADQYLAGLAGLSLQTSKITL